MKNGNQDSLIKRENTKEINLREYFEVIKRRFWLIVTVAVLATLAGYVYSYYTSLNSPSVYETSTRMVLGSENEDMNTLMVMITDPIIMESVKEDLELTRSSEAIAGHIEISRLDESQVVEITVTDQDPALAADIANSTASTFQSQIADILDFSEVQLLSDATENPIPVNESQTDNIIYITFIVGIIMGIGLAFLLDSLNEKVRKEHEVEDILGVPVIGIVSNLNKRKYAKGKTKKTEDAVLRGESVEIKEKAYNER